MSTYSWPESSMIAYMISSVIDRKMKRSSLIPSYREKSKGSPNFTVGLTILVTILPGGAIMSVPMIADGNDRRPRQQCQTRDAGPSFVETAVVAARSLGIDTEELAALQHLEPGPQRSLARPAA